jgi:hypothetical protein
MQYSFFDEENRLNKLSKLGDSLEFLDGIVNWNIFLPILKKAIVHRVGDRGGRPPFDNLLMFKTLVIKRLFNLSHDQTEFQINDRMSFMRFLGLNLGDRIPDAKTIWLYENMLSGNAAGKDLFDAFFRAIAEKGYITRIGSIVDATFIEAPNCALSIVNYTSITDTPVLNLTTSLAFGILGL